MAAPGPTFRFGVLAFLAMTAIVAAAATGLLVLVDPRSQLWWADRMAEIGAFLGELVRPFTRR